MDLSTLKAQVMAMFAIKQSQGSQQSPNDIFFVLYTLIVMTMIERAFRVAPQVFDTLWNWGSRQVAKRAVAATKLLPDSSKDTSDVSSITLRRSYETMGGKANAELDSSVEKVDGVLEYICSLDVARHIKLDRRYILHNTEEIAVTPHIRAQITHRTSNEKGELTELELVLSSEKLGINELRGWVDDIYRNYCFEKNNQLGQKKFYFNEVPVEPMQELMPHLGPQTAIPSTNTKGGSAKKNYRWESAPKTLTFTMNEFHTAKSFRNVFGEHVAELKERLDLFVNHPDWYQERGIPHSLGILLHGIPGAGKTSTIKAVAHDTGRHIFNLSLRPYTTQKQLTHLFFNENVAVVGEDGVRQVYRIPLNQRVYVIEDIDCLTDVVYQRTEDSVVDINGDAVTLSFLLNLLDGVLETPGRILMITTNHPQKLDKALIRPGRIDVNIRFVEASRELIADMHSNFYNCKTSREAIPAQLEGVLTPAEVLECFCNHFKDGTKALQDLMERVENRQGTSLESLLGEQRGEQGREQGGEQGREQGGEGELDPMKLSMYISPSNVSLSISEMQEEDQIDQEQQNAERETEHQDSQQEQLIPLSPLFSAIAAPTIPIELQPAYDSLRKELKSEGAIKKVSFPPLDMNTFVYTPLDVTINPKEKYGESGSHPKPHGGSDEIWETKDLEEFYAESKKPVA